MSTRIKILLLFFLGLSCMSIKAQTPARAAAIQMVDDSIRDNTQKLIKPLTLRSTLFTIIRAVKDSTDIISIINSQKGIPNGIPTLNGSLKIPSTYLPVEGDPSVPSYVKAISSTDISNWTAAFGWGNHSLMGYLTQAAADARYSLIPHNHNISNLTGVAISSPSAGQILQYDSILGKWKNSTISLNTGTVISDSISYIRDYINARLAACGCNLTALIISTQPQSAVVTTGNSINFSVVASGGLPPYNYQWTKGGTNVPSATTSTYLINSVTNNDAGNYQVVVRDFNNSTVTSNTAVLTVSANAPPTSNAGPDQTITLPTSTAILTGTATGTGISYLWSKESGSPSGGQFNNATQLSTSISGLIAGTYTYRLTVTDNLSRTATDFVNIVVNPAPSTTQFSFGYTPEDPYIDNTTAPINTLSGSANVATDLVFNLPQGAADNFIIVKVPASETTKTTWYHNQFNSGTIPDQVWRAPFTVSGFTYYITRAQFVLDYLSSIQLRQ